MGEGTPGRRARRAALAVVVAAVSGLVAAPSSGATVLGHSGRWITDAQGRVVVLHGVNMVYKRAPYTPEAIGFSDADATFLAANGFNAVRVGVIYKAVEPSPGVYDDNYLASIRRSVTTLAAHGVYSLLDFHQDLFNERFQGEGFPDWAVFDDGLPNKPGLGFPGNYLGMPALERAFDHFWLDDVRSSDGLSLQAHYANAWAHVASLFKDNPFVLGYDLFNEPWPGTQWQTCANPAGCPVFDRLLAAAEQRSITAIRAVDSNHIVWPEPNVIFNDGARTNVGAFDAGSAGAGRAGLSFHDYCLIADTVAGGGTMPDPPETQSCDTFEQLVFKNADAYSAQTGAALLLSEWGATNDYAQLNRIATDADSYRDSWLEWHYCSCVDPTTSGAGDTQALVYDLSPGKPRSGSNVNATKLAVLSRPYPQAVAGTPQSWAYDPGSRRFNASWSVTGPSGASESSRETEIFIPPVNYSGGYVAKVTGGQVDSAPGSSLLRVGACAGTTTVAVTVSPGNNTIQGGC